MNRMQMIRTKLGLLILLFLIKITVMGQQKESSLKIWNNNPNNPVILFLSGDGGFNSFSSSYCELLGKEGYTVGAVNSKSFFWDKKSADQIAKQLTKSVEQLLEGRKKSTCIFCWIFVWCRCDPICC